MVTDGEGGAAAAGTAADILGTAAAPAAGEAAAGSGDAGSGAADGAAAAGASGAADPEWYGQLPAEPGEGDKTGLRDWVKSLNVPDVAALAKMARDNQAALRESGRIKVPGADAKPEEIAAFHRGIGVPNEPSGYEIKAPMGEDGQPLELNDSILGKLAESAHKHGVPKGAFEALTQDFIQMQLDDVADTDARAKAEADATVKGWGADSAAKIAAVNRAAAALNIDGAKLVAMRNAMGADFTLNMLAKLGAGMGEDVMVDGGRQRFGVSGAEAQAELDKLKADPEFIKKVMIKGSPEKIRWDRLQDAAAEWKAKQAA